MYANRSVTRDIPVEYIAVMRPVIVQSVVDVGESVSITFPGFDVFFMTGP